MSDKIIFDLPKGLINWYNFNNATNVLYFGDRADAIAEFMSEKCSNLICCIDVDCAKKIESIKFDYIIAINVIEKVIDPSVTLSLWRELLADKGKIIIGTDNRLGIKYFCGDKDPFTGRNFDGIENYRSAIDTIVDSKGRLYSQSEIVDFLEAAKLKCKFYSVLPNLQFPQLIYSEEYMPEEELAGRYFPKYNSPNTVFLEEKYLYSTLIKEGLFHKMANSYLIECAVEKDFAPVLHVTSSMERGPEKAIATIVRSDNIVEKRMLYKEGEQRLSAIKENSLDLESRGLDIIKGTVEGISYFMPYIKGESLVNRLRNIFHFDIDAFIQEIDKFRDIILKSSNYVTSEDGEIILERGYIDLVPLNCIFSEGKKYFYDQEVYFENYPANAIVMRAIDIIYIGDSIMQNILPMEFFWKRYGMENKIEQYRMLNYEFINKLRNIDQLSVFWSKHIENSHIINSNRQKINYSSNEYQKLFVDVFRDLENKDVIVFGSGNFAERFLALYKKDYNVKFIVDNNSDKWGKKLENVEIVSPENLEKLTNNYRIIICIKNYIAITKQLDKLGISKYVIYDPSISYYRPNKAKIVKNDKQVKKYLKGYVAGVFDLFHVGHLNLLRRAKEQCEHLIVGVVTDEGVRKFKKTEPIIPFSERLEIVSACKYVDEAVEIPFKYGGSIEAYSLYKFDCQFTGSDYIDNKGWLTAKEYLTSQGSDLIFFPYTQSTSSTKLKAAIDKKLS